MSTIAHQYIHSLSREQEEIINNELRQFKYQIDMARLAVGDRNLEFEKLGIFDLDLEDTINIPLEPNPPRDRKILKKPKFNRAKFKRNTRDLIEKYESELDY